MPLIFFHLNALKLLFFHFVHLNAFKLIDETYQNESSIIQDNAPIHQFFGAEKAYSRLDIDWVLIFNFCILYICKLQTPSYLPDINVIELVWADLKKYIRKHRAETLHDLIRLIRKFEKKLTPAYCKRYCDHVKTV